MAWELITGLNLNSVETWGSVQLPRFSLVDAQGSAQDSPEKAVSLYDSLLGKYFLPQTDPTWLDELMTRFRVGAQWQEDAGAWVATTAQGMTGQGPIPGIAVVEALVAAIRQDCLPTKYSYPGDD